MPEARRIRCKVIEKIWLTPTVVRLRFEPNKKFRFREGQFLSLIVPQKKGDPVRRAYSFAAPQGDGYELCVKHVPAGIGSSFIAGLRKGDFFEATAPYGDFLFEPKESRRACFISTGTGVAPFRAMVLGKTFAENPPLESISIFGARDEEEIIFPGFFESLGFETIHCLSQPKWNYKGFKGRVTDYLASLPATWAWSTTDFYLCGNGVMVSDVRQILSARGVKDSAIYQEVYFTSIENKPVESGLLTKIQPIKKAA